MERAVQVEHFVIRTALRTDCYAMTGNDN